MNGYHFFKSPTAAGEAIIGHTCQGPEAWKTKGGVTYREIETHLGAKDDNSYTEEEKRDERKITSIRREYDARMGQSPFRKRVLKRFDNQCCLTGISEENLLIASHIKPWAECDEGEHLDTNNGLCLCATYDRLFDQGYFSLDDKGKVILPPQKVLGQLSDGTQRNLKTIKGKGIDFPHLKTSKKYIQYHREHVFKERCNALRDSLLSIQQ